MDAHTNSISLRFKTKKLQFMIVAFGDETRTDRR